VNQRVNPVCVGGACENRVSASGDVLTKALLLTVIKGQLFGNAEC